MIRCLFPESVCFINLFDACDFDNAKLLSCAYKYIENQDFIC